MEKYFCPDCGGKLRKILRPSDSMFNEEQFQSIRAGDYYCENCKGDRGKSEYRYFWIKELEKNNPALSWQNVYPNDDLRKFVQFNSEFFRDEERRLKREREKNKHYLKTTQ